MTPEIPVPTSMSWNLFAPGKIFLKDLTYITTLSLVEVSTLGHNLLSPVRSLISWNFYFFRCPVASLCYVPRVASSSFPSGGLIAGSLEGACFWEQVNETTYKPHVLPLESGGCTDIQVETESRHCLVTYRPGKTLLLYCNYSTAETWDNWTKWLSLIYGLVQRLFRVIKWTLQVKSNSVNGYIVPVQNN